MLRLPGSPVLQYHSNIHQRILQIYISHSHTRFIKRKVMYLQVTQVFVKSDCRYSSLQTEMAISLPNSVSSSCSRRDGYTATDYLSLKVINPKLLLTVGLISHLVRSLQPSSILVLSISKGGDSTDLLGTCPICSLHS